MAVKINGINHCAISVADIEETIQWYHDVFGFTVVNRSEIPGAGIKVAHLQGVGFLLEVFEAPGANALPFLTGFDHCHFYKIKCPVCLACNIDGVFPCI